MALATRRWKLEYYIDEGEGRLYDRLGDPTEYAALNVNHESYSGKVHTCDL